MPLNVNKKALTTSQPRPNLERVSLCQPQSEYRYYKHVLPASPLIECSFVNRDVEQLSDNTSTIWSWPFDRFVITISNDDLKTKVPVGSTLAQERDNFEDESTFLSCRYQVHESQEDAVREERARMIALYDDITGDYWPETWSKVLFQRSNSIVWRLTYFIITRHPGLRPHLNQSRCMILYGNNTSSTLLERTRPSRRLLFL